MAHVARPKVRSRKGGSAVPLDETDKQLLNLLQGSFPLDPRPFAAIAGRAGLTEEEVLAHCAERLARFKVPAVVEFVDALPRTPTGKVARRQLAGQR